jgi:hypothetical protein
VQFDNPIRTILQVLYDMAYSVTGTVGLTPLQVLAGVAAVAALGFLYSLARAVMGRKGWHLERHDVK